MNSNGKCLSLKRQFDYLYGCSFKFLLIVGVEESIVNHWSVCREKTQTTQKVRLDLNS
jgi:hypothetical protein